MTHIKFHNAKVCDIHFLTTDLIHFKLKCEQLNYKPGQYIVVAWHNNVMRSYSVSEYKHVNGNFLLSFYVSLLSDGRGSSYLKNLKLGDIIRFYGPIGEFFFKNLDTSKSRHIIATTGTGIAPVLSWIEQMINLVTRNHKTEIYIIQASKSEQHLIKKDFLDSISKKLTAIKYIPLVSHKFLNNQYFKELSNDRKVSLDTILNVLSVNNNDILYLCGNPNVVNTLMKKYENSCQIIVEAFG